MKREAELLLHSFLRPELVTELCDLISYRQENLIDDRVMIKMFPKSHEAELNFLNLIIEMYHEIEQLLYLTPPILHTTIREQLREDLKDIKKSFKKSNVKSVVLGKIVIGTLPQVAKLVNDDKIFDEYYGFLQHLLDRYERELEFFTREGFQTVITDDQHIRIESPATKDSPISMFSDPSLNKLVLDQKRFIAACEFYSEPVEATNKRAELKIIRKDQDGKYLWIGNRGKGIPMLGSFLKHLMFVNIIEFRETSYENSARVFLNYFNIEFDQSTANYLVKKFQNPEAHIDFFKDTFPEDLMI